MIRRLAPVRGSRLAGMIGALVGWLCIFGAIYALWLVTP